jgi:hypothetical protein
MRHFSQEAILTMNTTMTMARDTVRSMRRRRNLRKRSLPRKVEKKRLPPTMLRRKTLLRKITPTPMNLRTNPNHPAQPERTLEKE